jgi:hypothetical protein
LEFRSKISTGLGEKANRKPRQELGVSRLQPNEIKEDARLIVSHDMHPVYACGETILFSALLNGEDLVGD